MTYITAIILAMILSAILGYVSGKTIGYNNGVKETIYSAEPLGIGDDGFEIYYSNVDRTDAYAYNVSQANQR